MPPLSLGSCRFECFMFAGHEAVIYMEMCAVSESYVTSAFSACSVPKGGGGGIGPPCPPPPPVPWIRPCLLGKRRCKRETSKCRYVKSATLRQKRRGACGEIRPALESRIKHNALEGAFTVLKSRKQGRTLLLDTFCSVPGFTIPPWTGTS